MTPLEKAARALCALDGYDWSEHSLDTANAFVPSQRSEYYDQARAVLMAVREPDTDIALIGAGVVNANMRGDVKADYFAAKDGFTAMIDAILDDQPKGDE